MPRWERCWQCKCCAIQINSRGSCRVAEATKVGKLPTRTFGIAFNELCICISTAVLTTTFERCGITTQGAKADHFSCRDCCRSIHLCCPTFVPYYNGAPPPVHFVRDVMYMYLAFKFSNPIPSVSAMSFPQSSCDFASFDVNITRTNHSLGPHSWLRSRPRGHNALLYCERQRRGMQGLIALVYL